MTEQRNTPGAEGDALVSEAYRDLADERTPGHVDRIVLRAAEKEARPRYSRFVAWTRPMAWAATVMLSVALVLEVTDTPNPAADVRNDAPVDTLKEAEFPVSELVKKRGNDMRQKSTPIEEPPAEQEIEPQEPAARERAALAADTEEFKLKDDNMLQQAEEMARLQDGVISRPEPAVSAEADYALGRPLASAAAQSVPVPDCDEEAITTPQTWLECITNLEEAGRDDAAGEQRALLAKAFPDFDLH